MGWASYALRFTAASGQKRLTPASNSPGGPYGPALDNFTVSSVPLLASGLILPGALTAMGLHRRKAQVA